MTRPLHAEWEEIARTVAGSTATRAHEVAAFVAQQLQAQARRAAAGRDTARRRHEQERDKIIRAAGIVPVQLPWLRGWPSAVQCRIAKNPARYGFDQAPDLRTIRKAHEYLLANDKTLPSCTPPATAPVYATSPTT